MALQSSLKPCWFTSNPYDVPQKPKENHNRKPSVFFQWTRRTGSWPCHEQPQVEAEKRVDHHQSKQKSQLGDDVHASMVRCLPRWEVCCENARLFKGEGFLRGDLKAIPQRIASTKHWLPKTTASSQHPPRGVYGWFLSIKKPSKSIPWSKKHPLKLLTSCWIQVTTPNSNGQWSHGCGA